MLTEHVLDELLEIAKKYYCWIDLHNFKKNTNSPMYDYTISLHDKTRTLLKVGRVYLDVNEAFIKLYVNTDDKYINIEELINVIRVKRDERKIAHKNAIKKFVTYVPTIASRYPKKTEKEYKDEYARFISILELTLRYLLMTKNSVSINTMADNNCKIEYTDINDKVELTLHKYEYEYGLFVVGVANGCIVSKTVWLQDSINTPKQILDLVRNDFKEV